METAAPPPLLAQAQALLPFLCGRHPPAHLVQIPQIYHTEAHNFYLAPGSRCLVPGNSFGYLVEPDLCYLTIY